MDDDNLPFTHGVNWNEFGRNIGSSVSIKAVKGRLVYRISIVRTMSHNFVRYDSRNGRS